MNMKKLIAVSLVLIMAFIEVSAIASAGGDGKKPADNPPAPAPDYVWDDIFNSIVNLPGNIWNWIINGFNSAMQGLIDAIFQLFIILFKSPPLVGNGPVEALWGKIVLIMDGLLGIVFVGVGIAYMWSGLQPSFRAEIKLMLPNLVIFMILGHSSIYICQFALDLNDAMVEAVLGGGYSQYQPVMPPTAGIALILLFGIMIILVIVVGIVLALRVVIILFTTVMMPIACLCYVFPMTKGFAKNIISMFAVWTFLTFFESIVLVVAFIALGTMNQWIAWLIFLAALVFMTMLPKMIGKGLGVAGGSGMGGGMFGISALVGTTVMAATGVGAGVAGAAGAMKGGMAGASAAGQGIGGSVASGLSKAPMGFARGFGGAVQKFTMSVPRAGMKRLANPIKTFRQEHNRYANVGGDSSGKNLSSEVGKIRSQYGLRGGNGADAGTNAAKGASA